MSVELEGPAHGPEAVALRPAEREAIASCVERARDAGRTRWLARAIACDVPEPVECYARAGRRDRFLWDRGEAGESAVAWGIADETESAGDARFRDVRKWSRDVRGRIDWIGDARPAHAATFFGGFGFEPESRGGDDWKAFPPARFVLPEWIAERRPDGAGFVVIARVEPGTTAASVEADLVAKTRGLGIADDASEAEQAPFATELVSEAGAAWPAGPEFRVRADRSHAVFRGQVEAALDAMRAERLEKVVLARSLRVEHDGLLDVPVFLERLRATYPTCTLVAMGRGDDTFLAATPELLVRVTDRDVRTAALAGSAPRGRQPDEDRALGDALLASEKDRVEHAHVVAAIRDVLERHCEDVEVPNAPCLRRLFGIQHLETAMRARLATHPASAGPTDALALVEALHPTPAVGGVPRAAADSWLRRFEGLDRGWYAAPIGWLDTEGGGDFRVALRSGLIRNGRAADASDGESRALLFAGAGLVEGSDPEQELVETRIKLRALLAPLTDI